MRFAFWVSLSGILYTYAGYPVLICMLALLRPRSWKTAPIFPSVSVVLAVNNGVALLRGKIGQLLDLDYPNVQQVIVVSDGSSDGTAELLAAVHHPRLRKLILKEHGGKAVALNAGVAEATEDVILFVDIRPQIAPGSIRQLVSNFADPTVGCANGELVLRQDGHEGTSAAFSGLYWRYEKWIRTCEGRFDSPVGVYGGFYAVRRKLIVPQPPGMILDDMFQPLSIVRQGYRVVVDTHAYVFDTWPRTTGGEFHRKVRTLAGNFQLIQLAPWILSPRNRVLFQLVSHKLMRLVIPYLLILLQVSSLVLFKDSRIYASFALLQLFGLAIAIAALRYRIPLLDPIASPASALLVLNTAVIVGLYKFLFTRGPLWKIWNSSKPAEKGSIPGKEELPPETADVAPAIAMREDVYNDPRQ